MMASPVEADDSIEPPDMRLYRESMGEQSGQGPQ